MEQAKQDYHFGKIISSLIVLLLGLTAFNFGGSEGTNYIEISVFVILVLCLICFEAKFGKEALKNLAIWLIPFVVFAIFCSFSIFWISYSSNSIYLSIVNLLGIFGFMALGLLLRKHPEVDFKIVLFFILGGLALLVLISLVYTLLEYGPFYVALYANKEYFYDGSAFLISSEAGWLSGFSFATVTISYAGVYAFVLASSLVGLLFLDPHRQKLSFFFVLGVGLIGLLFLVLLPYKTALFLLIPIYAFAVLLRFIKIPDKAPLWEKIISLLALGFIVVVVLFMMVVATKGTNIYVASSFLSKIFNNGRITGPINQIVNATLKNNGVFSFWNSLFGMDPYQASKGVIYYSASYWNGTAISWPLIHLKTFEFSALMEGGLMAFISLCLFMVLIVISLRGYLHFDGDKNGFGYMVVFMVLSYFVYSSFLSSPFPFVRNPYFYVSPFHSNSLFLIIIFLIGYTYTPIFGAKNMSVFKEDLCHE